MEFGHLYQKSSVSSQRDTVGLAVYYLDVLENKSEVGKADIKGILKNSRAASFSLKNIHTYLKRLDDSELLDSNGGYQLTFEGINYFEERIDEEAEKPVLGNENFLNLNSIDEFYNELVTDINKSYRIGVYDGAMVLTRKLVENMLIDILRYHFGMQRSPLFYSGDKGQHHSLSTLIENFNGNLDDFKPYNTGIDQTIIDDLNDLREESNAKAHSIKIPDDREKIKDFQKTANKTAKRLEELRKEVKYHNQ